MKKGESSSASKGAAATTAIHATTKPRVTLTKVPAILDLQTVQVYL